MGGDVGEGGGDVVRFDGHHDHLGHAHPGHLDGTHPAAFPQPRQAVGVLIDGDDLVG